MRGGSASSDDEMKVSMIARNAYLVESLSRFQKRPWLDRLLAEHGITMLIRRELEWFEGKMCCGISRRKVGTRSGGTGHSRLRREPNSMLVRKLTPPFQALTAPPVTEYSKQKRKNFCRGDLAFYPDRIMGGVGRQSIGRTRAGAGKGFVAGSPEHDGQTKHSLRTSPLFLDGEVRSALPLSEISDAADSGLARGTTPRESFLARYYQARNCARSALYQKRARS